MMTSRMVSLYPPGVKLQKNHSSAARGEGRIIRGEGRKGRYVCSACGAAAVLWTGKCPSCGEWGALEKDLTLPFPGRLPLFPGVQGGRCLRGSPERIPAGLEELDRVLGGGWVPGGVFLLGGKPGIGKSTLLLQHLRDDGTAGNRVLYISGEESESRWP